MPSLPMHLVLSRTSRAFTTSLPALRHRPRAGFRQGSRTPTAGPHPGQSTPPGQDLHLQRAFPSIQRRSVCKPSAPTPPSRRAYQLRSGSGSLVAAASLAIVVSLLCYQLPARPWGRCADPPTSHDTSSDPAMTTSELPAGRPGNLTPEEEEKLRQLWALVLRVFGSDDSNTPALHPTVSNAPSEQTAASQPDKGKKKRALFGRRGTNASSTDTPSPAASSVVDPATLISADTDDKYGQTQQFHHALANLSPDAIRETMWTMVKHDNPDALLLRFLRARKWDVEKALVMLVSTMNWRATEMHVDDDIMKNGEGGAAAAEKGEEGGAKLLGHEFLDQMRMGKSFLHGMDKVGRPICFVRVRLHRQGQHSEEALERNTVFVIETCRMLLKPPIDTATIIFDMTDFSMANMDYTPVKFMIKCFEANYPECLGTVLVYKAPWIFQGIWKIIKGWLDPVVASKVHFLNNSKDMASFIDIKGLPKEVDGSADWEYKYEEPIEGENAKMADTETRDGLLDTRRRLIDEYERETLEWIKSDSSNAAARKESRTATAARLRENYWELDPYIRARSLFDRVGMIKPDGGLDLYAWGKGAAGNGTPQLAAETSADDVD